MATIPEAHRAMMRRIAQAGIAAHVVWPEQPGEGNERLDPPRIVMQPIGGAQRRLTLGGRVLAFPEIAVKVETSSDPYGAENAAIMDAVLGLFPADAKFDGVRIMEPPVPAAPIPGDDIYSVPVIITGWTTF